AIRRFHNRRPARELQISVDLRRELSATAAFTFHQFRNGPDFPRARSDLVSILAAVRRLVAHCFCDHARDGVGRNWSRRSYRGRSFSFAPPIASSPYGPFARRSDFGASLIFTFSRRIDPGAERCVRSSLVADRGYL